MVMTLQLIDFIFTLLSFAIIARALLSWFVRDPYNPLVYWLDRITEPIIAPLRRFIPPIGMMDITPIVALLILQFIQAILQTFIAGMYY